MGLLGTSPLSNHPLAGGCRPQRGRGPAARESLPGAGGSLTHTPPCLRHVEAGYAMPAAAAGSSATGGAALVGAERWARVRNRSITRPGAVAPAPLAQEREEDDGGDWGRRRRLVSSRSNDNGASRPRAGETCQHFGEERVREGK